VKIPTHDAIWPEDVALAVGRQTNTLVLHAQATHFSQRFKAYLSVKVGGDVFANPLERGLHAHAQKVVHRRFSFPGALGKQAKLGSATASATGLHLTEEVWFRRVHNDERVSTPRTMLQKFGCDLQALKHARTAGYRPDVSALERSIAVQGTIYGNTKLSGRA
jgi:hypothetical protein